MNGAELLRLNETNPRIMVRIDATGRKKMWCKGITGKNVKVANIGNTQGLKGNNHDIIHKSFINDEIVGQAPDCTVIDYDCGAEVYLHEIADAIYKAVEDGCHFVSVAYSHYSPYKKLNDAIEYAWNNNCMVISTVGNNGDESVRYPAAYPKCVGIGSISNKHEPSDFSVYGSNMIATYYGENVPGYDGKDYQMFTGTSFAEPIVTGVIVLILDEILSQGKPHPGCDVLLDMLIEKCIDLNTLGYDKYTGYGIPTLHQGSLYKSVTLLHDLNSDGLTDRVNEISKYMKDYDVDVEIAEGVVNKYYKIIGYDDIEGVKIPIYGGRKQ